MVVAVLRLVLSLPFNDSLKGKRAIVKSVLERSRNRFRVSASEIEDHDSHRRAVLGFAYVTNDSRLGRSVLDKLTSFVAGASQAEIVDCQSSLEHIRFGELRVPSLGEDHWNPPDESDLGDDDGDEEG